MFGELCSTILQASDLIRIAPLSDPRLYLNSGITLSVMHRIVSITTSRGTDDVQLHSNMISSVLKASRNI